MPAIRHILFPFDFSAAGMAAIPYVRALATRFHARVTIFSVVPPAWVSPPGIVGPPAVAEPEALLSALQAHLDKLPLEGMDPLPVRLTALGDPAEEIAEFTRDNAVDLVMIPTHGHGLFRRLLLGSVASKVLHDVHCPVWTAAHAEKQHSHEVPRKILCAIDGTERSGALARWAAEFSGQMGASLEFVHVVAKLGNWLSLQTEEALEEKMRAESAGRIENLLRSAGMNGPARIAMGEVVETITEQAREDCSDLIVLGRGAIHDTLGRLRTHAHGIIQHSPCPVLSV